MAYTNNPLIEQYQKGTIYNKLILLQGENDLGQKETLNQFINFAKKSHIKCIDLSFENNMLSLNRVWDSLSNYIDINCRYLNSHHDNYIDFIFYQITLLCKENSTIFFYNYNLSNSDCSTIQITKRILEYILPNYKAIFVGCDYTDSQNNTHLKKNIDSKNMYVSVIRFNRWNRKKIEDYLIEKFAGKLIINKEQTERIISAAFGNPYRLNNIVNYLIQENIICYENNKYTCMKFNEDILFFKSHQYIIGQYNKMDNQFKDILRAASVVGEKFNSLLLENPLRFSRADLYLNEIERINQLVLRVSTTFYEFFNNETYTSIKSLMNHEEYDKWCECLANYYYTEGQVEYTKRNIIACSNLYLKCAYYFTEVKQLEKAYYVYLCVLSLLISLSHYENALDVISIIENLNIKFDSNLRKDLILKKAYCLFSTFRFEEASKEYRYYLDNELIKNYEILKIKCQYALSLYNCGNIKDSYTILKQIYEIELNKQITSLTADLVVTLLSNMSSIEETLCIPDCAQHYNLAMTYAKNYSLTDIYYELLRKSFIVHTEKNVLVLLKTTIEYYKKMNYKKDYAMALHNYATFSLLYGDLKDTYSCCNEALSVSKEIGSEGIHYTINCLGLYWNLTGHYKKAITCFKRAYKEDYELFSKITILLNEIVSNIKLKHFNKATSLMATVNRLFVEKDAENLNIILPFYNLVNILLYQEKCDIDMTIKYYSDYFKCETEKNSYRYIFAAKNYYYFCKNNQLDFPNNLGKYLKSENSVSKRLLKDNIVLVHLAFAE